MCYNKRGDRMKELINVNYKAIFKYPDHKETIIYNEIGTYSAEENKISILFDTKDQHIEIHVMEDVVYLKNNNTTLKLVKDRKIGNEYQSAYGTVALQTKLVTLSQEDTIKIKYQLFDQVELLSEVYLLITIKALEN